MSSRIDLHVLIGRPTCSLHCLDQPAERCCSRRDTVVGAARIVLHALKQYDIWRGQVLYDLGCTSRKSSSVCVAAKSPNVVSRNCELPGVRGRASSLVRHLTANVDGKGAGDEQFVVGCPVIQHTYARTVDARAHVQRRQAARRRIEGTAEPDTFRIRVIARLPQCRHAR